MSTQIFVELLKSANPNTLDYLVKENKSLVIYALNKLHAKPGGFIILKSYMHLFGGYDEVMRLNAYDVKEFLRKNRPDLLFIINQQPGWLEKEIETAKKYLPGL